MSDNFKSDMMTTDSEEFQSTMQFKNQNPEHQKMLTCHKCQAVFKSKDNLTNHLKRKTPCQIKPESSEEDDKYFKQFYRKLEASDPRFNPRSSYMCITCLGLFKSPSNVKIHIQSVHLGRKPFACERCEATFTTKCSMQRHIDVTHNKLKYLQCHQCGKEFASGQALKYHAYRKHDQQRRFQCDLCNKMFKTPNELNQHNRKIHQKPSALRLCSSGPAFPPENDLSKHENFVALVDSSVISNEIRIISHGEGVSCSDESRNEMKTKTVISQNISNINTETDIEESCSTESAFLKGQSEDIKKRHFSSTRKPFKCKFCGFQFTKLSAAKTHIEINHLNIQQYQCGYCGTLFLRKNHLKAHSIAQHDKMPSIIFQDSNVALEHIIQSKEVAPLQSHPHKFKCGDCGTLFTRKDHLKTHSLAKHSELPNIIHLNDETNLVSDSENENSLGKFKMESFQNKTDARIEDDNYNPGAELITSKSELPETEYLECASKSRVGSGQEKGCLSIITPESVEEEEDLGTYYKKLDHSDPRFSQKSRYICLRCDRLFKSPSNMKVHILSIHLEKKSFSCHKCSLKFVNQTILQSHIKNTHTQARSIQCHLCGDSFTSGQALKYHVFRIHDTVRRFGCDQCDKTFKAPVELSHHKKRIHDKSTSIQCDLCGTVLSSKDYLKKHIATVHENIRRFQCHVCQKLFTQKNALLTHIETVHERKRNHGCSECGKLFGTSGALAKHVKSIHLKSKNIS